MLLWLLLLPTVEGPKVVIPTVLTEANVDAESETWICDAGEGGGTLTGGSNMEDLKGIDSELRRVLLKLASIMAWCCSSEEDWIEELLPFRLPCLCRWILAIEIEGNLNRPSFPSRDDADFEGAIGDVVIAARVELFEVIDVFNCDRLAQGEDARRSPWCSGTPILLVLLPVPT